MACEDIADAWSAEIKETSPVDTGLMRDTVHAEGDSISIQYYWKFVNYGHRIVSPRGRGITISTVDAMGNETGRRTLPNPFMETAWDRPRVQNVLQRYAGRFIHIPYPLKRVSS